MNSNVFKNTTLLAISISLLFLSISCSSSNNNGGRVVAADLATGARTILSNDSFPDSSNLIESPVDITFDSLNNRILVTDSIIGALLAIHPESGQRVILSK
jgi:hypothetical protein